MSFYSAVMLNNFIHSIRYAYIIIMHIINVSLTAKMIYVQILSNVCVCVVLPPFKISWRCAIFFLEQNCDVATSTCVCVCATYNAADIICWYNLLNSFSLRTVFRQAQLLKLTKKKLSKLNLAGLRSSAIAYDHRRIIQPYLRHANNLV